MNVLSLFAGIGGLDLGLERAGMSTVGQVELDPFCRRVLAKHWPEVPRHDDVRSCVDWWGGGPRPAVHVVAGGYPCTPFSTAGRQLGMADERWGWPWFYDVVRALRPRYVVVENVSALVTDRDAFGRMLGDLASSGYDAEWDCVPAAAVGAPHLRDRLFLVAYAQRDGLRNEPVTEPGGSRPALAVDDGTPRAMADADGEGQRGRSEFPRGRVAIRRAGEVRTDADGRGPRALADADCQPKIWTSIPWAQRDPWATEPDVGRVAHGVPARVDRLRALGNAVVPQVAEYIGRLIVAADGLVTA